jgi:hypothetical protein
LTSRIQNSEFRIKYSALSTGPQRSALSTQHSIKGVAIHMDIIGANPGAKAAGVNPQSGKINYLKGDNPADWHTNVATFGRVEYQDVYPGIDVVYYGKDGQLEYDFIVSPGADPSAIALDFAGAENVAINPQGDLVLHTGAGDLIQQKPYLYQETNGTREKVAGTYLLSTQHSALSTFGVFFDVGAYDASRPLVIDPLVLGYSTFLGGTQHDSANAIAVDKHGNAYVGGWTSSAEFPTTPGAFDRIFDGPDGYEDAFITKLNATGTGLVYSTFLGGGGGQEVVTGIAVDQSGNVYLSGATNSFDFPTTPGVFGGLFNGDIDAFVTKLRADGSGLLYSSYLGASDGYDFAQAIAVDAAGNAYLAGDTTAPSFPTTPGAFDTTHGGNFTQDAFVTKVNPSGTALAYSTLLGGSNNEGAVGIALDDGDNAYVTGQTVSSDFPTTPGAFDTSMGGSDAFVTKLNAGGTGLHFSTFLGGTGGEAGWAIAVDAGRNPFVTGYTTSSAFPTTPGAFDTTHNGLEDIFVTKLRADGADLKYSTFLGGSSYEGGYAIAVDQTGSAYVTGYTSSLNFPVTPGALDSTHNGGSHDVFVTKLTYSGGAIDYSTYMGGSGVEDGYGVAVDGRGNAYVTGHTRSSNFPTTPGAFDTSYGGSDIADAFVAKFCRFPCPTPAELKLAEP